MSILQPEDIAFFKSHWPTFNYDVVVPSADAYAEEHAAGLPATVKLAVARLALRYLVEHDVGERECLQRGINSLILMWR